MSVNSNARHFTSATGFRVVVLAPDELIKALGVNLTKPVPASDKPDAVVLTVPKSADELAREVGAKRLAMAADLGIMDSTMVRVVRLSDDVEDCPAGSLAMFWTGGADGVDHLHAIAPAAPATPAVAAPAPVTVAPDATTADTPAATAVVDPEADLVTAQAAWDKAKADAQAAAAKLVAAGGKAV